MSFPKNLVFILLLLGLPLSSLNAFPNHEGVHDEEQSDHFAGHNQQLQNNQLPENPQYQEVNIAFHQENVESQDFDKLILQGIAIYSAYCFCNGDMGEFVKGLFSYFYLKYARQNNNPILG